MAGQHVQLHDACVCWERVLINAKSLRVREVVRKLAVHLVDVAIVHIANNRYLRLEWGRRKVGRGREGSWVGLR